MLAAADIASRPGGATRQRASIGIILSTFSVSQAEALKQLPDNMPAVKTKGIHAPLEISPALAKIIGTKRGRS